MPTRTDAERLAADDKPATAGAKPSRSKATKAADTAPERPASGRGSAVGGRPSNKQRAAALREPLSKLVAGGAMSLTMVGAMAARTEYGRAQLTYDANVIASNADAIVAELVSAAESNASILRVLESLITSSEWARLASLAASVLVPILANHGAIPVQAVGFIAPGLPLPPERPPAPVVPITDAPSARMPERRTSPSDEPVGDMPTPAQHGPSVVEPESSGSNSLGEG